MIRSVTTKQRPNRVIHIDGYNAQKPPPLMESLISTPISCCFFVLLRYGSWNESVTHRTGIETTGRGLSCFPPSPRLLPCLRRDAFAPETIVLIVDAPFVITRRPMRHGEGSFSYLSRTCDFVLPKIVMFRDRVTTVDTLPVELLAYIFVLAVHSPADVDTDSVKIPARISAVSKHWRHVAKNTPALWTNLCATIGSIQDYVVGAQRTSCFDTSHFHAYLKLSRNYAVDILIDARDPEYDFGEPDLDPDCEYSPPFSTSHMRIAMSLLLPHVSRWRSLSILTDCWNPMRAALELINPIDAPHLKQLTLMRCNDYISHAPQFEPQAQFLPVCISPSSRLRHLTLRGVPGEWSTLADVVPRLETLEITSLASGAMPSMNEIRAILSRCASTLRTLRIINDVHAEDQDSSPFLSSSCIPIHLPNLRTIYTTSRSESCLGLIQSDLFDAPNVYDLTVECDAYGTISPHPNHPHSSSTLSLLATFKTLGRLTLKGMSCPALENANVRHLTLERVPLETVVLPFAPALETLVLRDCRHVDLGTVRRLLEAHGDGLKRLEVHLCHGEELKLEMGMGRLVVFRSSSDDEDVTDDGDDDDDEEEEEAFSLGGTFNDPVFDALYKPPDR